jgi:hypothetical protein
MAQIREILNYTKEIELILESSGVLQMGLTEKIESIRHKYPKKLVKSLRWINHIKNRSMYEKGFEVSDFKAFKVEVRDIILRLHQYTQEESMTNNIITQKINIFTTINNYFFNLLNPKNSIFLK